MLSIFSRMFPGRQINFLGGLAMIVTPVIIYYLRFRILCIGHVSRCYRPFPRERLLIIYRSRVLGSLV